VRQIAELVKLVKASRNLSARHPKAGKPNPPPFSVANLRRLAYRDSEFDSNLGAFRMQFVALLLQNQPDPEMVQRIMMFMIPIILFFCLVVIAIVMVPCWFILKKAGFTPWLSLLCLIPSLGILVLLYVLAFADWKVVPASQAGWMPPPYPPQPPAPPQA
jgi:hypothetical protein